MLHISICDDEIVAVEKMRKIVGKVLEQEQLLANEKIKNVVTLPLGPVISTHVGPNTLAVFTIGKEAR